MTGRSRKRQRAESLTSGSKLPTGLCAHFVTNGFHLETCVEISTKLIFFESVLTFM